VNSPSSCRKPRLTNFPFTDSFRGKNYVNKARDGVIYKSELRNIQVAPLWELQVLRRKLFS